MASRHAVYNDFNEYKQQRDGRTMDAICRPSGGFKLQVQQSFLRDYITQHPEWRSLLLYHGLGSGKTCTAITLAEKYMEMNPGVKATVVLPARLRTNFIEELISPCGMDKYLDSVKSGIYFSAGTSEKDKAKIKRQFTRAIEQRYDIISYEKFRIDAYKAGSLSTWARNMTRDRIIIVDEVHNMLSDKYERSKARGILQSGIMRPIKGANTVLLKYLAAKADPTCKMLFLTATPIFDNLAQFKELVQVMTPGAELPKDFTLKQAVELLRGKVSFFPGTSPRAYPTSAYNVREVPFSRTQDEETLKILQSERESQNEDNEEAFLVYQRMASIAALPGSPSISANVDRVVDNQKEYCPKVLDMVNAIETHRGKHLVYSTFIAAGLKIVEAALRKKGWVSLKEAAADSSPAKHHYKTFAVWDGSLSDADKMTIKAVANKVDNMDGRHLRVILGSPSIKEGVSFKHVQHVHLLDAVWNSSAKSQIEGRAIRFCSHVDIPRNHDFLNRHVVIHVYKSVPRRVLNPLVSHTCDEEIYDKIIPKKEAVIRTAENALKAVAIDHFLFKKLYQDGTGSPSPRLYRRNGSVPSPILLSEDVPLRRNAQNKAGMKCPKKRRPSPDGTCNDPGYPFVRMNSHNEPCCFKKNGRNANAAANGARSSPRPKNVALTCPKPRRPDAEGNCKDGFSPRPNKHGVMCCYKL